MTDPISRNIALHYASKIRELRVAREEALLRGSCQSFDEYSRLAGEINGLKLAETEITDAISSDPDEFDL